MGCGHSDLNYTYIVNQLGEILAVMITKGNVDDSAPVSEMTSSLTGKLYGDKGYLSKALSSELWEKGIELITCSGQA